MRTAVQRPVLVRSSDRMIAGVCSGLADHLGWPVKFVRLGMILACFAGGAGVAFYAWLWTMVPTADENAKRNARRPASPIAPAVSLPPAGGTLNAAGKAVGFPPGAVSTQPSNAYDAGHSPSASGAPPVSGPVGGPVPVSGPVGGPVPVRGPFPQVGAGNPGLGGSATGHEPFIEAAGNSVPGVLGSSGSVSGGLGSGVGSLPGGGAVSADERAGFGSPSAAWDWAGRSGEGTWSSWFSTRRVPYGKEILLGAALLLVAAILIARQFGVEVPLGTLIPAAAILGGAAIAWMQLDETRRAGLVDKTKADQAGGWVRLAAGLALVVAGVLVMVSGSGSWEQTWLALLASVAVLGGVALVLLPWGLKFWKDLETERAGRIRETERAEIAAHLHDSVLQTLALIQRRAGSEQDVVRLARAQERELRSWLFSDPAKESGLLADRIKAVAAEVEDSQGHAVEVVAVGDTTMTERHEAMVQAAREAMLNAARHGGGTVSVYVESTAGTTEIFVKDRGPGFDLDAVPDDRLGVKESIIGRMKRHGGTATINSSSDGTEVRLALPSTNGEAGDQRNSEARNSETRNSETRNSETRNGEAKA
ncbi:PspC domain-containing protein [Paenarthrobacter nicotinovorans]|uniref:PspC domain-containing protein n=1 Tax=Paenarthrobacter nicotinovorans TaxID=29320 RepID=A0ABV0GUC0_PAENI|nr:ATP-binding protein [Paenarthrobacter nicotinovorans]